MFSSEFAVKFSIRFHVVTALYTAECVFQFFKQNYNILRPTKCVFAKTNIVAAT